MLPIMKRLLTHKLASPIYNPSLPFLLPSQASPARHLPLSPRPLHAPTTLCFPLSREQRPSRPVVLVDDPTLPFTNTGMNSSLSSSTRRPWIRRWVGGPATPKSTSVSSGSTTTSTMREAQRPRYERISDIRPVLCKSDGGLIKSVVGSFQGDL